MSNDDLTHENFDFRGFDVPDLKAVTLASSSDGDQSKQPKTKHEDASKNRKHGKKKSKSDARSKKRAGAGKTSESFDDYEDYEVAANSEADFAVRIAGDSMEPYIHDDSIVLVKRGATIFDGDIGLFFVDGDMKCKQYCQDYLGNVYLFSLNRARRDADVTIPASSGITICCFGKVLLKGKIPLPQD